MWLLCLLSLLISLVQETIQSSVSLREKGWLPHIVYISVWALVIFTWFNLYLEIIFLEFQWNKKRNIKVSLWILEQYMVVESWNTLLEDCFLWSFCFPVKYKLLMIERLLLCFLVVKNFYWWMMIQGYFYRCICSSGDVDWTVFLRIPAAAIKSPF